MTRLINTSALPFTMALGASLIGNTNASPDAGGEGIQITAGFVVTVAITALVVVQGLAQVLAPVATLKVYKSPTGKMNAHMFATMGTSSLSLAITTICLLVSTMSYAKSIGCALLPWVVVAAMNLMTGKSKEVGYGASNDVFPVIVGGLLCGSCLSGYSFADQAAVMFGGIMLVNGTTAVAVPNKHAQAWGSDLSVTKEKEPILPTSLRALGFSMLSLGTMITLSYLDQYFTPVQAFGYAWVWIIMMAMIPVFSKNIKGGLNAGHMVWFVPHALVLGTTIFSS